ncbi:MAG: PhnH protein [Candidatus Frackibacter sp. T328-2]|jgi:phosphonate C-P lyase system protein PhnH|uniref:Phosphonate C-P lyase system protein PhnH n=1 Tax=Halanaerobium congolense TaxID=54121 RepID=A0A318ECR5_9FIRM|nr:phosphonate C-P lyase system protein PhnH [Halanaerobium congolense]KXS38145.1 MAG: PhnH protein [Candidatus Frackibacter sp. T328-2]PXV65561.1 phosphonate C-P lyase system protein PhnH [Halanaerobium congolense]
MSISVFDNNKMIKYSQNIFNTMLYNMSRPGEVGSIKPYPSENEFNLEVQSTLGIAYTLLDTEVSFYSTKSFTEKFDDYIEIITTSKRTELKNADYIFMSTDDNPELILEAKKGNLNYPERGASVIIRGIEFDKNNKNISLSGPGIKDEIHLPLKNKYNKLLLTIKKINSEYPLGIDFFLHNKDSLTCIARTSDILIGGDK